MITGKCARRQPPRHPAVLGPVLLAVLAAAPAGAGTLAEKPLFLGLPIEPNVLLGIDDSFSMQYEVAMAYGGEGFQAAPASRDLFYLFPDGNHISPHQPDSHNILPLPRSADARSPVTNRAYFDPAAVYPPWTSYGGTPFEDAPPTAAPWDPVSHNPAAPPPSALCDGGTASLAPGFPDRFDLTRPIACADRFMAGSAHSVGYGFDAGNPPVKIPAGTRLWSGMTWMTVAADFSLPMAMPSLGVGYFPATFYLPHGLPIPYPHYTAAIPTAVSERVYSAADQAELDLPAGFVWDGKTFDQYEIRPGNFSDSEEYAKAIQNFANWFTYHRKRHAAAQAAIGAAFKGVSDLRLAVFKASDAGPPNPPELTPAELNPRTAPAVFDTIYALRFEGNTSPLNAVDYMGRQLQRQGVIDQACQKNYGILVTDGNPDVPFAGNVGNIDGSRGTPYADALENTLGDIAMKYYETNLNGALPTGQVPIPAACDRPDHDPWLDCRKDLHMNFHALGVGLRGQEFDPLTSTVRSAYGNPPPAWPTTLTPGGTPLEWEDDLWHATINGRGGLSSAARPQELRDRLLDLLATIVSRKASGAAVATNSAFLGTDSLVFQTEFDPAHWSGDLLAYRFRNDALEPVWRASSNLPAYPNRRIFSSVPQGTFCSKPFGHPGQVSVGIVFEWEALNCVQQQKLDTTLEGLSDHLGPARLDYLKGDTSLERRHGGSFRNRDGVSGNENLLGDFVHSAPVYAGGGSAEDFGYSLLPVEAEASSYPRFLLEKRTRPPMVYVGGNDGMLHAFDASPTSPPGGREVYAYVPAGVYDRLSGPSSPGYSEDTHKFSVDGSPVIGDAYLDGAWGTYLVGTTGAGARDIFAFDITHPNPADSGQGFGPSQILWDWAGTGESHPNLGYTLARPVIVRTNSNDERWGWAVIVGNGYNSPRGHAVLLVISLADGRIRELDTGAGGNADRGGQATANGLATPIAVDLDRNRTTDVVYAGDLLGNVWKFDFRGRDSEWKIAYGTAAAPAPWFTACATHAASCAEADRQPITAKPRVAEVKDSRGGLMVFIGTGKYFENGDNIVGPSPQVESVYGLWDRNTFTEQDRIGGTSLVRQTIDRESILGDGRSVRASSIHPVDFATKNGWFLDLQLAGGNPRGERVTGDPVHHDGRITFATFAPSSQACTAGGSGWIMELVAETGSRVESMAPSFDLGGPLGANAAGSGDAADGRFDTHDLVPIGEGDAAAPSGLSFSGIPTSPRILHLGEGILRISASSQGELSFTQGPCPSPCPLGRQTWRQIR